MVFLWMHCESRTVYYHGVSYCTCLNVSFGCAVILVPKAMGQYILIKIPAQICQAILRSYQVEMMSTYLFSFVYFAKLFDSCQQKYCTKVDVGPGCTFGMIATSFPCMICFWENRPMQSIRFIFNRIESRKIAFA
jgi:hypothetical protein